MHDADSHIMEPPAWLEGHLAAEHRARLPVLGAADAPSTQAFDVDRIRRAHADPEYRAEDASQIMLRKNFAATGSFIEDDRPRALDLLGFASQLVFDTFTSSHVLRLERDDDPALAIEVARGQHRAMLAWCSVDPRLLPVCIVPLGDMAAAVALTREAIDGGAAALQIGQYCPPGHSPSHVELEPMWAMAAEAGVPVVLHVAGAGANVMNPAFFENGLPPVPDFHGGDGNFKSIDYMSIPLPVMQTLNALVIDGVLQRHPDLRIGVIEVGASWIPSWMRQLDSAHEAFRKNEERLQQHGDEAERVRAPAGARHAVPARRHRLDDRQRRRRGVHVLVRLPARGRRPQPDRPLRAQHGRGRHRRRRAPALLLGQLRRPAPPRARTPQPPHPRTCLNPRTGVSSAVALRPP